MPAPRSGRSTAWRERASASNSVNGSESSPALSPGADGRERTPWRLLRRLFGRDRHEGSTGGRCALRPPDEALESEDEGIHLRRTERHLHHRPWENGEAV